MVCLGKFSFKLLDDMYTGFVELNKRYTDQILQLQLWVNNSVFVVVKYFNGSKWDIQIEYRSNQLQEVERY